MEIRLFGGILIVLSTTLIGFRMGEVYHARMNDLYTLKRMLQLFDGEIRYGNALLEEVFFSTGRRLAAPFGVFLNKAGQILSDLPGALLGDIWEREVKESLKNTFLTEKDREELISFGRQLGHLDIQMQQKVLMQYERILDREIEKLQNEAAKKQRLYRTLGVLSGLFVTIVLF